MRRCLPRRALLNLLCFLLASLALSQTAHAQMRQVYTDNDPDNHINKISFYSPADGVVGFDDWLGFTSDSGHTYTKRYISTGNVNFNGYPVNLTFGFIINGVKAFNVNNVLAYGHYGLVPAILRSTNGGQTFTLVFHSQYNNMQLSGGVADMIFPTNGNIGYAIDPDRILKTTNGGQTWSVAQVLPQQFLDQLSAADDINVLAMSSGYNSNRLFKTVNGTSWSAVTLPALPGVKVNAACLLSPGVFWISVYDDVNSNLGRIYKTVNGGTSFTLMNNIDATPFLTNKMLFTDANTGYAFGEDLFTVYKTTSGGARWERIRRDNSFEYLGYSHYDIHIRGTQLWAGGGHGFLELNTNPGASPRPSAFYRVDTLGVYATGNVNLINYSDPSYTFKWFVNGTQISTAFSTSYAHQIQRSVDTIRLVATSGGISDTLQKIQWFEVPVLPLPTSFFPTTGSTGTQVTILGSGFTNATGVSFGGTPAQSYSIFSDTKIFAIVAGGATGAVGVSDIHGTFSTPGFTYFAVPSAAAPTVNSFSPPSGPAGTTVTITGTNFGGSTATNRVKFGSINAAIISASPTQIICTAPLGAEFAPINVYNSATALQASSKLNFNMTFADSSNFTANSFGDPFTLSQSNQDNYLHVIAADLDGDGKPDVLNSRTAGNLHFTAYRNTSSAGNLSFGAMQIFLPGTSWGAINRLAAADIDGDGKPEVLTAPNDPSFKIFRNISAPGQIDFANSVSFPILNDAQDVTAADFDGDGRLDPAVAGGNHPGGAYIMRNTSSPGNISLAAPLRIIFTSGCQAITAGDLDGDGKPDIAVHHHLGPSLEYGVSFARNTSLLHNISFSAPVLLTTVTDALDEHELKMMDYDGDGKLDLFESNGRSILLFRNTSSPGNISFAPPVSLLTYANHFYQGANNGNISGDSKPDLFTGQSWNRLLILIKNSSTPGISAASSPVSVAPQYPDNTGAYWTVSSDVDMDGKPDLIVSATNDRKLMIYRNMIGKVINKEVCSGGSKQIETDFTGPTWQWQVNTGSGFVNLANGPGIAGAQTATLSLTGIPVSWNNYKYRCISGTDYSSTFLLIVSVTSDPLAAIATSTPTICYGAAGSFSSTITNGGVNPVYQWQRNGQNIGANSPTLNYFNLQNNDVIRLIYSYSNFPCGTNPRDTSNEIIVSVTGGPSSVSISSPNTSGCAGTNFTFTAAPVNAINPSYQWTVNNVNAGTNSNVFSSSTLTNGNTVRVSVTYTNACGTAATMQSNTISVSASNPVTASVSISTASASVCSGVPVTFTAQAGNGGPTPVYQWKVNGTNAGANSAIFTTSALINGDQVSCTIASSAACVTPAVAQSNTISISIVVPQAPAATITSSSQSICSGTPATFTVVTTGINSSVKQWQINGANAGTNSNTFTTAQLMNNDAVRVIVTGVNSCGAPATATSNLLTAQVTSLNTPVIVAAANVFTVTNPDAAAVYTWQMLSGNIWQDVVPTATGIIYTAPAAGDYRVRAVRGNCFLFSALQSAARTTPDLDSTLIFIRAFPNPAGNTITLNQIEPSQKWDEVEILNAQGIRMAEPTPVSRQREITLDVHAYPPGIYFVRMRRGDGRKFYLKFIKR